MNSLEISLYCKKKRLYFQEIKPMFGNYVFGRNYRLCNTFSNEILLKPTTVINFPKPPDYLSSIHAVICQIDKEFHLVDGWGEDYSRNGIQINNEKVIFRILKPNDVIYLGSKALEVVFREPVKEYEKITENSEFF